MHKRWLVLAWLWLATACGPGDLPAFANPPPDDSGTRDASDDEDAGSSGAGAREVDLTDATT